MAGSTIGTAYVQILPSAEGIKNNLTNTLGGEASKAGPSIGSKLGAGISKGLKTAAVVAGAAIAAAGAAAVALGKKALTSYANYEQLIGGVETLFGSSAEIVAQNASEAFKTDGLSANEYMETVTSFSASLLQSLGGDTEKAASYADMAITDMSDNANKMGTDMSMIQSAYQGFAKQNYTMLDNLKLGYGGTKTEMERLIKDAEALDSSFTASRDKNKELTLSYSDIVDAIHIVQTNMGITGTTATEASTTIQGSVNSMKSAWQNLLTGFGNDNADLSGLIDDFVNSAVTAAGNIVPRFSTILSSIAQALPELISGLIPLITSFVTENLPTLISAGVQIIGALITGIVSAIPQIIAMLPEIITTLVTAFTEALPEMVAMGQEMITSLSTGLAESLPVIIPAIATLISQLVIALTDPATIGALVDGAILIVQGLADGLIAALPVLIEAAPQIISNLLNGILQNIPKLIEAGIQLMQTLMTGIIENLPLLIDASIQIMIALLEGIIQNLPMIIEASIQLIVALVEGLIQAIPQLIEAIPQIIEALVNAFIEHGPELIMAGVELLVALVTGIGQALGSAVSIIGEKISEWVTTARGKVTEFGQSIHDGFTELVSEVGGWINDNIVQPMKDAIAHVVDIGEEIVDKIKEGINNAWSGLTSWFNGIWDKLFGHLSVHTTVTGSASSPNGASGYATGLDYVPYDEFPAILHKGEAVLTATEADAWRKGGTGANVINVNQTINSVPQTPVELASATAAYFELARWAI